MSSQPFWQGLREGRFLLQHDAAGSRHHFYPKALHDAEGRPLAWVAAQGDGTVVAHTLSHVAGPGFEGQAPYVLVLVKLREGPRVFAPLVAPDGHVPRIGEPVRVVIGPPHPAPYHFIPL